MTAPLSLAPPDALCAWALSLWQPWAWLCAAGHKPTENRPLGFVHKNFRGAFWIHAGLHYDIAEWGAAYELAEACAPGIAALIPRYAERERLPTGAIIGRATIAGVLPVPAEAELPDRWRMANKFGFVLKDAALLKTPIKCRGHQGFFRLPDDVLSALRVAEFVPCLSG